MLSSQDTHCGTPLLLVVYVLQLPDFYQHQLTVDGQISLFKLRYTQKPTLGRGFYHPRLIMPEDNNVAGYAIVGFLGGRDAPVRAVQARNTRTIKHPPEWRQCY
jgi:hypothetical protein